MLEFEIVVRGCYRPNQVIMRYDPSLKMFLTPEIQEWMDALWQKKLAQARQRNRRLFDALLFRYINATAQADGTLHVIVGDTSYKEYVTTRVSEFASGRPLSALSNALAVCSVVQTSDGYILLDKREGVDVYAGRYHVIGGFFERTLDMTSHTPDPFSAMRREIREETGIQAADIQEQYCLGVVYDQATPHGEMCFLMRLNIPLDEVLHSRTPEENEIKHLHTLHVTTRSLHEFIVNNHGNISATGEPNLLLYGKWKFGEQWFEEVMEQIS